MERQLANMAVYGALHALGLAHMHNFDFSRAERCCKRALWGKRKILGKENPSCWETLALLSRICEARGETEEAKAHRTFIPASYQPVLHVDPLAYLGGHGTKEPRPPPTIPQTATPSTTQVSQSRNLIVGVHFGVAKTAVSYALATHVGVEEAIISEWRCGKRTIIDSTVCLTSAWANWSWIQFRKLKLTLHRLPALSTTTSTTEWSVGVMTQRMCAGLLAI